jgi:hypothetical protein
MKKEPKIKAETDSVEPKAEEPKGLKFTVRDGGHKPAEATGEMTQKKDQED